MSAAQRLRVAVTVDPNIPVPPHHYGGIERVVDFVVRGLAARGHEVTLFAHPDSHTAGTLVPYGAPPHVGWGNRLREVQQLGLELWRRRRTLDVVLSWGRLAALLPILPLRGLPKIQRYCREEVPWKSVQRAVRLADGSLCFAAPTTQMYAIPPCPAHRIGRWHTVHDGVPIGKYTFTATVPPNAPLVFLGRLEPIKGAHHSIAIAKAAGRPLVIAGNKDDRPGGLEYFTREIAPHVNGGTAQYIGPVDDAQKNALLGRAAALLLTSTFREPFGIVMVEAMACGTPVIAFDRGSAREIVKDGVTGFICGGVGDAARAVAQLHSIDRSAVRADCAARFGDRVVVDAFEQLLQEARASCGVASV